MTDAVTTRREGAAMVVTIDRESRRNALNESVAAAIVAALDAVFGGFRAYLDAVFDDKVFVVSFISNVLIAALIVWVGDLIGVGSQLSTAVVVVLGIRIFANVAHIRRKLFHA